MPTVLRDAHLPRRYFWVHLMGIPPSIIAFAGMWMRWRTFDVVFWSFFAIFIWCWAVGMSFYFFAFRRYRCPLCRGHIKATTPAELRPGDPIRYFCENCDVIWETGFSEAEPD
jgi:hypothetical protein